MVQPFPRGLEVTAVCAKDLAKRKLIGTQDPYLAFYIQKRTKFTWVAVKGGVKPEWNQTIKFNQIHDSNSPGSTTLTVSCVHKKTGVKLGHTDGLIGKCEIDLKNTLFASQSGVIDGWYQLMHDGKEVGKVQLRIALCEPSAEEDESEEKPVRLDPKKSRPDKKTDKKTEEKTLSTKASAPSLSTSKSNRINNASSTLESAPYSSSSSNNNNHKQEVPDQPGSIQRNGSQLSRTRSMQDFKERKQTIRFQEPNMRTMGSRSLEEVRDSTVTPLGNNSSSSDGDSLQTNENEDDEQRSISSPKQTFTLQDSEGNINPLNVLIAPFDPSWLEPTPPILRRALSAQYYYDDLQTQMATNPRDLFPRPQSQQGHIGFPSEQQPHYMSNGYQNFQSFGQGYNGHFDPSQPQQQQYQPQQQQQQPQQQQQRPFGAGVMQQPSRQGTNIPTPPLQNWPPQQTQQHQTQQQIPYQPHTVFQPRQSRNKMFDMSGQSKHASLPARYQMPASHMQHLQNVDPTTAGQISTQGGSHGHPTMTMASMADQTSQTLYSQPIVTQMPTLGPAAGYLPDTYSQEHQRALLNQLGQPLPPQTMPTHPTLGSDPRLNIDRNNGVYRMQSAISDSDRPERPVTRNTFYTNQSPTTTAVMTKSSNNGPGLSQPIFYASPTPQEQNYVVGRGGGQHSQQSSATYSHGRTTSLDGGIESFSTVPKSPAAPIPAKIPARAKDAIFAQYTPRSVAWDGKDIQDSLSDDVGRRILSRYMLGTSRERNVREGFYIKEKSPLFADSKTIHQRQQQQQRRSNQQQRPPQPQRQNTMQQEGNDRVILKYMRSKREWEIDCAMMRYLTCQNPEAKLESQYLDYPQPQQHCQIVNPFVLGLYETFNHPLGTDYEHRFLSVVQWYPETLLDYISDRTASGGGLEVTLPVVRSLIESVEWIHSRKICHLNIKPTNFVRDPYASSSMSLLRGSGWKLIDFEAARVIDEEIVGRCTFSYAAPEILEGHSTATAVRAKGSLDIWSLGLVIYEFLTDQPLFQTDEQAKEKLLVSGADAGRGVQQVRYYDSKNIDKEYQPLLDAMLAKDPQRRLTASQILNMDLFKTPISPRPVPQDQLLRNNNIQTLRDLKETRLCNLRGGYMSGGSIHGGSENGMNGNGVSGDQHQLLEGLGRILDSPFDQVPRLFMLFPPMTHDLDPTQPFSATNLFQNKGGMRLVLLCEGLSGYGEDAHVTDHRGYVLHDPAAFVQDVGKLLLYLVAAAGSNNPGYETPGLDKPLTSTGTPLDNCQRWYPSLRSYYEILNSAIQRQLGVSTPSLNELRSLRGPTLKSFESWLARLVRKQSQIQQPLSTNIRRQPSTVAPSDTISHAGLPLGGSGYDDLSDHLEELGLKDTSPPEIPEVTGPGGGLGYGGLYKMPVGTCGDRWICRGCVTKQMAMAAEAKSTSPAGGHGHIRRGS